MNTTPTAALEHLRALANPDPRVAKLAERLLNDHPDLPLARLFWGRTCNPEPGELAATLYVDVADGDTAAVAAWASAAGTTVQADGATHFVDTVIDGIRLHASTLLAEEDAERFPLTASDFPEPAYYGVRLVELGEEGELIMAFGHIEPRRFLAAASARARDAAGTRYVLDRDWPLQDYGPPLRVEHTWAYGQAYPTRTTPSFIRCSSGEPNAVPVTCVRVDGVESEEAAPLERCPACNRASRSTADHWMPGRHDYIGPLHTCRGCGHTWPAHDAHRTPGFHAAGACLVCGCTDAAACPGGCRWVDPNPLQVALCSACHTQLPAAVWDDLAAAEYGAPHSTPGRDSWLVTEALRGTPPHQAAQTWTTRAHTPAPAH